MKIEINELQHALNLTLNSIKEMNGEDFEIEIDEDYYYYIPAKEIYNIGHEPKEIVIGSLVEDIKDVKRISSGDNYPTTLNLNKIISILRFIAESVV